MTEAGGGSSMEARVACMACSIADEGSDLVTEGLPELLDTIFT